jgi:hypothetical protein
MKISDTRIPAVKVIEPKVFEDDRGYFFEAYRKSKLQEAGIDVDFALAGILFVSALIQSKLTSMRLSQKFLDKLIKKKMVARS